MAKTRTPEEAAKILDAVKQQMAPAYQPGFTRGGHDITHFQRMEKIADIIIDPEDVDPLLVKIAIWCHDLHRTSYFNYLKEEEKPGLVMNILFQLGLPEDEIILVIDAVAKHSRLNEDSDSPVLIYLKDIDHLDMGAIGILRIAAHRWHFLPYQKSDFEGKPESTAEKDLQTMIHDLHRCLEWEKMLRTKGAKKLGERRFAFMRHFLREVKRELKELELIS